jgi:hypothetical protein
VAVAVGLSHFWDGDRNSMIMTIYLNEAMNKMVEKHGNSSKQLPRTSSDSTLLMALQKAEAKINDGFGFYLD